jgi:hypothetical protein
VLRQIIRRNDVESDTSAPIFGNAADVSQETRGWFFGHFMPGEAHPLRSSELELKWYTHPKGETRATWAPGNPVRTLNILIRGHFVLLFPDQEIALENSLVLTVRWPSVPQEQKER